MALVDWALTCDYAYFDPSGRLCVIGADANGLRTVSSGVQRLTLVAHLAEYHDEPLDPVLTLRSPDGEWRLEHEGVDYTRERQGNSVLFHLPSIQLSELGTYHFELALGTAEPTMLDLRVAVRELRGQRVHLHGAY
jgi:hypothetical protein